MPYPMFVDGVVPVTNEATLQDKEEKVNLNNGPHMNFGITCLMYNTKKEEVETYLQMRLHPRDA